MANIKQNKSSVRREHWKSKYYWVARENGKITSKRAVKNSRLTLSKARELYSENNTLFQDRVRAVTRLTNVTETVKVRDTTIDNRFKRPVSAQPKGITVQYVVQGTYKGSVIVARSFMVSSRTRAKTPKLAKEQAWESFLERIAQASGLAYDADEGIKQLDDVSNIQEGWVYYK